MTLRISHVHNALEIQRNSIEKELHASPMTCGVSFQRRSDRSVGGGKPAVRYNLFQDFLGL